MDLQGLAPLALHLIEILADPEKCDCRAGELLGISRLLQKRGQKHLAGRIYQRALDGGLPKAAEDAARRELALLAKREGSGVQLQLVPGTIFTPYLWCAKPGIVFPIGQRTYKGYRLVIVRAVSNCCCEGCL